MAPPRRANAKQKTLQRKDLAPKKQTKERKNPPTNNTSSNEDSNKTDEQNTDVSSDYQFTYEVMWCLQQMDALRTAPKTTERQAIDIRKAMKALLNEKTPLIKKRQLMRSYCGDYRVKMAEDERRQRAVKASVATCPSLPKASQFHRAAPHCSSENTTELAESIDRLSLGKADAPLQTGEQNLKTVSNQKASTSLTTLFKKKSDSSFMFNFDLSEND